MEENYLADKKKNEILNTIRNLLAVIAPEIPSSAIIPEASCIDLGLDIVTHWALANALEHEMKIKIIDKDIKAVAKINDFMNLVLTNLPTEFSTKENKTATKQNTQAITTKTEENILSATTDLANFFNN